MKCKNLIFLTAYIPMCSLCYAISTEHTERLFECVKELQTRFSEDGWVVFAVKIRECEGIYYYLFPRSLSRSSDNAGISDMENGVRFADMTDMINYINEHNVFGVPVWDGFHFMSRDLIHSAKVPLDFSADERAEIKAKIANWVGS